MVPAHVGRLNAPELNDEASEVVRIRLASSPRVTVFLSEFLAADRIVSNWAEQKTATDVSFEVTLGNGSVIRGTYERTKRRKGTVSFSNYVRAMVGQAENIEPPEGDSTALSVGTPQ
jgi:hypothetical protein